MMVKSEHELQRVIQAAASQRGGRLWRNNVGAFYDGTGRFVRYGLANESAAVNERFKSGDLIGITPRVIMPGDVGTIVGVFTSVEVKRPGWVYTGKGREAAQRSWIELVRGLGGIGHFMSSEGEICKLG